MSALVPVNRRWTMGQDPPKLGFLPGEQVTRYGADVSAWTPSVTLDAISRTILSMFTALEKQGFIAKFSNIDPGRTYSNFRVTLIKAGLKPFSINDARAAIGSVVAGTYSVRSLVDAASEIILFVAEAVPTAVSEKGRQQTADALRQTAKLAADLRCKAVKAAIGLPCVVVYAGAAVVALGLLAVVFLPYVAPLLGMSRALGEVPERRRSRKSPALGSMSQKRGGSNQRSLIGDAGRACKGTGPIGGPRRSACLRNYIRKHR